MDNKDLFIAFNNSFNNSVLTNPDFTKAEAFGGMRASILDLGNVIATNTYFEKKVLAYAGAIDKGRGATVNSSGDWFKEMYDWVGLKKYAIDYDTDERRVGIAIAIMRKMAKEGSYKHRNVNKRTEIFKTALDANLPRLIKDLVTQKGISVRSNIVKAYKK